MHGATRGRHEGLAGPEHPSSAPTSHGTEECGRRGGSLKDRALPHTASLEVRTNLKPNRTEVYFLSLYPQDGDRGVGEVRFVKKTEHLCIHFLCTSSKVNYLAVGLCGFGL